jgi:hypothetical protein
MHPMLRPPAVRYAVRFGALLLVASWAAAPTARGAPADPAPADRAAPAPADPDAPAPDNPDAPAPADRAAPAPADPDAPAPDNPDAPAPADRAAPAPADPNAPAPADPDAGSGRGPDTATPAEMTPRTQRQSWTHRYQVGIDVAVGAGYSFAVTYRDKTWCGETDGADNASFCTGMHPVFLDFGLSFGVLDQLDVLAEFRLGLMDDLVKNRPLIFMPGLRVWIDPHQRFKIGIGFQLVLDFTEQDSDAQQRLGLPVKGESLDLGGRVYGQFQYDFYRYFGIFARIGAMVTARKWVQFNLAGQFGVQTRFP